MPTLGEGAIGSIDYTPDERKVLAKKSLSFTCQTCKVDNKQVLLKLTEKSQNVSAEAKELASQIDFKVIYFNLNKNFLYLIIIFKLIKDNNNKQADKTPSKTDNNQVLEHNNDEQTNEGVIKRNVNRNNNLNEQIPSQNNSQPQFTVPSPDESASTLLNNNINNSISQTTTATSSSRQRERNEDRFLLVMLTILSAIFVFLFLRRIYLMFEPSFPI
jgi:hypothetical protein